MPDTLIPHRGLLNKMGATARPIQIPWTCHQTGDCCRSVPNVTVTPEERAILENHAAFATRPLDFVVHPDDQERRRLQRDSGVMNPDPPRFYQLVASPCPFLSSQNLCTIHASRPYNCRRFMCGRVDVAQESFEAGGPMGCWNLSDRVATSLRWQDYLAAHQRRAQKDWALSHGWKK